MGRPYKGTFTFVSMAPSSVSPMQTLSLPLAKFIRPSCQFQPQWTVLRLTHKTQSLFSKYNMQTYVIVKIQLSTKVEISLMSQQGPNTDMKTAFSGVERETSFTFSFSQSFDTFPITFCQLRLLCLTRMG
jgi:hypothetical protein